MPGVAGPAEWWGCFRLAASLKRPTVSQRDSCNDVVRSLDQSADMLTKRSPKKGLDDHRCKVLPHAAEKIRLFLESSQHLSTYLSA